MTPAELYDEALRRRQGGDRREAERLCWELLRREPLHADAVYLLDGHPHHASIGDVVQEDLLTHLYGTPVGVVRTPQGDLFTRAAWRDPHPASLDIRGTDR